MMGRGHYAGGSSIIYVNEAGTRFGTSDIHEAPRHKPRKPKVRSTAEDREMLLHSLMAGAVRKKGDLPRRTPAWLIAEVGNAGGADAWALRQPTYERLKIRNQERLARKAAKTKAPAIAKRPPPPSGSINREALKQAEAAARRRSKSPTAFILTKGVVKPRIVQPKAPQPKPVPLAGLGPESLDRLVAKGWSIIDKMVVPPIRKQPPPRARKKSGKRRNPTVQATANVKVPVGAVARPPVRSLPQSSMIRDDHAPKTQEEWKQGINWNSSTDGGW